MMWLNKLLASFIICFVLSSATQQNQIRLQKQVSGLVSPTGMAHAGDGSNRLFVCEQYGVVRVIQKEVLQNQPFLDIRNKIIKQTGNYSERGLLGLAFHPQFKANGKFYVYYSAPSTVSASDHKSVIEEYQVSTSNKDIANVNSARVVMEIEQPESNHNGGQLEFGADGYLYIGIGDGGGAGDRHGKSGNGQNLETLLGKILRIDVNATKAYHIPKDNPFVGVPGRDEIWAYGLRNPWKFSFDKTTGRLFCGDVGQDKFEEVNLISKGGNYGWRIMEANHCFNPAKDCNQTGLIKPIAEYPRTEGICVIGGYVYRGSNTMYQGQYFFADWNGTLFKIKQNKPGAWIREILNTSGFANKTYINAMGEDEKGNIYVLGMTGIGPEKGTGVVYKLDI